MDDNPIQDSPTKDEPQAINQIPSSEKSPKFTKKIKLIILLIVGIIVVILSLVGLFLSQNKKSASVNNSLSSKGNENSASSQVTSYQTFVFSNINLNDSETNLYLSDDNKVFKAKLDGSQPQEIATLPHSISTIDMLANGYLLINTNNSKYEKTVNKQPGDADYKQVVVSYGYWLLNPISTKLEQIDEQKYQTLQRLKDNTNDERIYTKELTNGQAEILLDKLDGSAPTKIGLLKEKPLKVQVCEVGENCLQMKYPSEFYQSFNGDYLLNKPPGGGGLGEPGIVVSRDGSKVYKIDFYWYVSSAIWIGNDKLLTKGQDGKQKTVTLREDGTFNETSLEQDLSGNFSQNTLSPSGKFLFISDGTKQNSLYDLEQNKITPVETLNEEQVRNQLGLLSDEIINQRYYFIGWNKNSDKVLYADTTGAISSAHNNDRTIIREIKVYDVKSGKVYTVVKLNPNPSNPDDYLINGKPKADITHFAIR